MSQIRPRLTHEEYNIILSFRKGKEVDITKDKPKILIFDIETSPMLSYVWGLWKQNINLDFLKSDWFIISWAAKFLGEDNVYSDVLTSEEALKEDDSRIVASLWDMIDEADIVVSHNGKKFDVPKMNTRFLFWEMPPPSHYEIVDTLTVLRKEFKISSNRLDYVNRWLGIERKLHTDASLWVGCLKGDIESLEKMREYNEKDVEILEKTYNRIRAWIKSHPNWGTYTESEESQCPVCGSHSLTWEGYRHTRVGKYKAYRCDDCGYVGSERLTSLSKAKRERLVR